MSFRIKLLELNVIKDPKEPVKGNAKNTLFGIEYLELIMLQVKI